MGAKSDEVLEITYDELQPYLHAHHSVYMDVDGDLYYLTDVNDLGVLGASIPRGQFDQGYFRRGRVLRIREVIECLEWQTFDCTLA